MIDISAKISNEKPTIKIAEGKIYEVNNSKNNILLMDQKIKNKKGNEIELMDEIIKQELKKLGANIITLNVNIYDLEENIKKNVLRILSYFSKNVTTNIDCKGKKNR